MGYFGCYPLTDVDGLKQNEQPDIAYISYSWRRENNWSKHYIRVYAKSRARKQVKDDGQKCIKTTNMRRYSVDPDPD